MGRARIDAEKMIEATIARSGQQGDKMTRQRFLRTLKTLVKQAAHGNHALFCRQMGWNEWALNGWLKNGQKITFPKLLEISLRFQTNPVDLCNGATLWPQSLPVISTACAYDRLCDRARKPQLGQDEQERVRKQLLKISQSATMPPALSQIAAQFSLTRGGLKYWFPELCANVTARRKRMRAAQKTLALQERNAIVSHAVVDMVSHGKSPSRRAVDAAIRSFGLALARPDVFRSYQTVMNARIGLLTDQPFDQAGNYAAL